MQMGQRQGEGEPQLVQTIAVFKGQQMIFLQLLHQDSGYSECFVEKASEYGLRTQIQEDMSNNFFFS